MTGPAFEAASRASRAARGVREPVRTCVGCRARAPKTELIRLVWRQTVVLDPRQREPGRGAYLHPGPDCLGLAVRRRSVGRALRVDGVDPAALVRCWEASGLGERPGEG